MKKFIIVLMSLFALICFSFVACKTDNQINQTSLEYAISQEDVAMLVNDTLNLQPIGKLNGQKLNDATFTFNSADQTVIVIENNALKSLKVGATKVVVNMQLDNKQVATKEINVTVNENQGLVPSRGFYQLFMVDEFRGKQFENEIDLSAQFYNNGEAETAENIVWESANSNIASVENNKLVAKSLGKTSLVGTYTDQLGKTIKTKPLTVSVDTAIVDTSIDLIIDLKKDTQTFYTPQILGAKAKIGKIVNSLTGTAYSLQNEVLTTPSILSGEYKFTVYSDNSFVACNVDLVVADLVIYNAKDMLELAKLTTGYVVLANDINGVEYVVDDAYIGNAYSKFNAFSGTFNGLGHTVSNLTLKTASCGLVCASTGATWKNVRFEDVVFGNWTQGLFGYKSNGANVIDNVYISLKEFNGFSCGALFALIESGSVNVSNSVIDVMVEARVGYNGLLFGRSDFMTLEMKNVIVFGKGTLCSTMDHSLNRYFSAINSKSDVLFSDANAVATAVKNGTLSFSGFNKYWDVSGNVPKFNEKLDLGNNDNIGDFDPDWVN